MTPSSPAGWSPASLALLDLASRAHRGPRQDGLFALWLVVRVAESVRTGQGGTDRAHRRRIAALEERLSSLALGAPLRRALASALPPLREATAEGARLALRQLVAPARDLGGPDAGRALELSGE